MLKNSWLCILFFIGACNAAEPSRLQSGIYEGLQLAVDDAGVVTGYFSETQGTDTIKSCVFYLQGQAQKNQANVTTWNSQSLPGKISAEDDAVNVQITKGRDHPGCMSVLLPKIADGLSLDLTVRTEWKELRRISAERAYFYQEANETKKLKTYVVKENIVGVLSVQGDWMLVEYKTDKKTFKGWIGTHFTSRLEPPK